MHLKSLLRSFALPLCLVAAVPVAASATPATPQLVVSTQSQFSFTGTCTDCTGQGIGTLTLQNYTPGTALTTANFVYWSYNSNLLPNYFIDSVSHLSGSIGAVAGHDNVVFYNANFTKQFTSQSNGNWCTGNSCLADIGTNGTFSPAGTSSPSPTPEPMTLSLVGTGLAALASLRKRRA